MANVAALTFLAARAVPLGWVVGVAGGVPLARAAQRHGGRAGYAAATASLVETMAIMGPARMGIPVPHAVSAPWLGVLYRKGRALLTMALAGALVRSGYYLMTSVFSILVLIGLEAYVGSYEQLRQWLGFLPAGTAAALWLTAAMLVAWSLGAGLVQAWVLRRGLRDWDDNVGHGELDPGSSAAKVSPAAHPRAGLLVMVALVGFVVALSGTRPWVLGGVAVCLAMLWVVTQADARTLGRGLLLALPLALSTLAFGLVGGIGFNQAVRRGARVALLVLIAVWLHRAAGSAGLRDQSLRLVRRLRRFPTLALAGTVLGASVAASDFGGAARRLGRRVGGATRRPTAVLDASLAWLADESTRLAAPVAEPAASLPENSETSEDGRTGGEGPDLPGVDR
ncbi:hypothetical protein [Nocardioides sp.]|jgi:hypothetical protein|uniref:hypothetical protein n=1 Tax=Nocardioides sp. TaxID=35761 RepID=UPI000C916FB2|nr:hypothetical protein [Nocardioides sp.]MAS54452.1 hypothetical protein [Pimelobacter sp.]MDE0777431.1 hypothetical protein [Nocardioides sp.]